MNCESIKVTVAESKKEGLWLQRSIRGLCQVLGIVTLMPLLLGPK